MNCVSPLLNSILIWTFEDTLKSYMCAPTVLVLHGTDHPWSHLQSHSCRCVMTFHLNMATTVFKHASKKNPSMLAYTSEYFGAVNCIFLIRHRQGCSFDNSMALTKYNYEYTVYAVWGHIFILHRQGLNFLGGLSHCSLANAALLRNTQELPLVWHSSGNSEHNGGFVTYDHMPCTTT